MQSSLRQLKTQDEYDACVLLQKETWGQNFGECVPPALLQIGQKIGGVSAGAFDQSGDMVGFVFGLTGLKEGKSVHWSHMLAVSKGLRGEGIGRSLKLYQRELLLEMDVESIYWTYDPLVAKNAHLNFNKLGVRIAEYVEDMYGDDTGSDLHRGLGMDRFIVEWPIAEPRVEEALAGKRSIPISDSTKTPIVNTTLGTEGKPVLVENDLPSITPVRIEIPENIETVQNESVHLAANWRSNTKRAFVHYLDLGYQIETFYRDGDSGRCFYGLRSSV